MLTIFVSSGGLNGPLPMQPFLCTLKPAGTALATHSGPQTAQPMWRFFGRIWQSWPTGPLLGMARLEHLACPRAFNLSSLLPQGQQGHLDQISLETGPPSHTALGNGSWQRARKETSRVTRTGDLNPKPGWASAWETLTLPPKASFAQESNKHEKPYRLQGIS